MIKVALVGCGRHSTLEHATPLARLKQRDPDRLELVAACDLDEDKARTVCERFGFARPFTDLDQMLAQAKPDAVVAVMPTPAIVPMAERLLATGIPCTIEKPPGESLEQMQYLRELCERSGAPHQVSFNRRFNPWINRATQWLGEHGELLYLRVSMLRSGRLEPRFIWTTGLHCIDAAMHIAGPVAEHDDRVFQGGPLKNAWHDLRVRYASGTQGVIQVFPTCGQRQELYELFTDNRRASVSIGDGLRFDWMELWHQDELVERVEGEAFTDDERTGAFAEMDAFLAAVAGERAYYPTMSDALPSAELAFACFEQQQAQAPA